jgi:hypothetical protein
MTEVPSRPERMKDCEVVDAFVAFLAARERPGLQVDGRPEEETDGEIDAVAGDLAVEHTSIDTLPNQRRDSEWHLQVFRPLETEFLNLDVMLWVLLPHSALQKGQDWAAIRDAFRGWLKGPTPRQLAVGEHPLKVPRVPFPVTLC